MKKKEPPITTYKLSPEELEKYKNLKPPTDRHGQPLKKPIARSE